MYVTEVQVSVRERGHVRWSLVDWRRRKKKKQVPTEESHTMEKTNHSSWRIERLPTKRLSFSDLCCSGICNRNSNEVPNEFCV